MISEMELAQVGNVVTGNQLGSNTAITFKGSGDVGFGTATMLLELFLKQMALQEQHYQLGLPIYRYG